MSRQDALDWAAQEKVVEAARRFALRFSGAVNSLKTYAVDHPSMQFSHRGVASALSEIYELTGSSVLEVENEAILVGELRAELEPAQHPHVRDMVAWMRRRDAQAFSLSGPVSPEQVQRFIELSAVVEELAPSEAREHINRLLLAEEGAPIHLVAHRDRARAREQGRSVEQLLVEGYLELAALTEELLVHGARSGTLAAIARVTESMTGLLHPRPVVVPALLQAGQTLAYEARHVADTTVLAIGLGARLGMELEALQDLARAVATMDVGMTVLPVDVRRAGRAFTNHERSTLRSHPLESVRVHLRDRTLDESTRRRVVVAMEQHLGVRRDGYPAVRLWPPLHLFSRIAAVCDAYAAMTATSPWRRGLSPSQALAQLLPPAGRTHDPLLVAELCALLVAFPEACRVRLSDGRIAAVLEAEGPSGLPVVRLVEGEPAGGRLDLGARDDRGALRVTIAEVLVEEAPAGG
jgi:HD-GYP domain-containing protein (c-di-GMP phosphodiesterase class II)